MPTYSPNDSHLSPAALQFLRTPAGLSLRAAIAALPDPLHPTVAQVSALRKTCDAPTLHAALTLAALQPKATAKFPHIPFVFATPEALEQASSHLVASHKAARFAPLNPSHLYDLCAGIGGDSLPLADIAPVTAIDLSPARLACLAFNAQDRSPPPRFPITTQVADIRSLSFPTDALLHIDPARRSNGKRSAAYADLIPGPDFLEPLFASIAGGVIKLSPAVSFDDLPPGHLELISLNRSTVQALLWRGTLAAPFPHHHRTATLLSPTHPPFTFQAPPARISLPTIPQLETLLASPTPILPNTPLTLYELDGSLTRSSLAAPFAAQHSLLPLTPDGGYLLSTNPSPLTSPALTPFSLLTLIPFSEKKILHSLSLLPSLTPPPPHGPIEVKSRGHLPPGIDTDHLQRLFSAHSPHAYTLLIFPYQDQILTALTTRPIPHV